ncbi:MAG TPA: nucleotidyltransferase family protein, partial [Thermoanaerobaculia bacterium]|nr:nucleotidyltransferase family protein [Thermoanaerobaculia bacterium]
MAMTATTSEIDTLPAGLAPETADFYRAAMAALEAAGVPVLVGGAYAYARYTGIVRHTKDFDVFIRPGDFDRALDVLARKGWKTDRTFPHWLGKAWHGDDFVDLIFSSGNGVAQVDDLWFEHAVEETVLDRPARLVPAEEMIWSKAFIMERERFDGADVAHVLHSRAVDLDWDRLLRRFEPRGGWRVLLAHLVLFGYIYPGDAQLIPGRVLSALAGRLSGDAANPEDERVCRGPILSRSQYLVDVLQWGYEDARLRPE